MRLALLFCFLSASAWMQTNSLPPLGAPAGSLRLKTLNGELLELEELTRNAPALVMWLPPMNAGGACHAATELQRVAAGEAIKRVLLIPGGVEDLPRCASAAKVRIARAENGFASGGLPEALMIDDSIRVRFRISVESGEAGWLALRTGVARWFQGRQMYEANCGHCHGFDGAQASAPETKTLVGITRKHPDAKVLALGAQFGGVDMTGWSDAKKETLLTYLRGL